VRIAGINWYDFETTNEVAHDLWAKDCHAILNTIKSNGYNAIRLPYSNQMVENPIVPSNISFANGTGAIGLRIILDNHRSEAGNSADANGLWYTSAYPESAWINDWKTLVSRHAGFKDASGNLIVIAVDLRNEPHLMANGSYTGSGWTSDSSTSGCATTNTAQNWAAAAQRAGNAALSVNSNLAVMVEGIDCYNGDCDWLGGNLEGVSSHHVTLTVAGRLVYSAYDYGLSLFQQSWFKCSTNFATLSSVWNKLWGYINADRTAPILVGEFGTSNNASDIESATPGSHGQWFHSLVNFLQNNPSLNWTY
jgi:endoglucanase